MPGRGNGDLAAKVFGWGSAMDGTVFPADSYVEALTLWRQGL